MKVACPFCGADVDFDTCAGQPALCPGCGETFFPSAVISEADLEALRRETAGAPGPIAGAGVAPGQRLGHYEILEPLGRGGMAVVCRARDTATGRIVALKLLPPELHSSRDHVRAFLREVEAVSRLRHPGIVPVREAGCHCGRHFFAMEYVEGQSLAAVIARGKLLPEEAARVVGEAARAVGAAHRAGVFHRDLKPSNLMVRSDGRAVVLDFGLSALYGEEPEADGLIVGTPAYLPPERARGERSAPPAAGDVYSLGAVLYEAVAGQAPYGGVDAPAVVGRVLRGAPPPPRTFAPGLSPRLEGIILKAMARAPADRYPTPDALADDLDRYLAGDSVRAEKPGLAVGLRTGYWLATRRARRWVFPAVCVLLGLALIAWLVAMLVLHRLGRG